MLKSVVFALLFASVYANVSANGNVTDVGASHNCSKNLHHCHFLNAALGIMCLVLLLSNIGTVVWVALEPIRGGIGRIAERLSRSNGGSHTLLVPDN